MLQLIFLLVSVFYTQAHPIHVSVSEVECTSEKIEWTARIYKDDLLVGLYGKNVSMERLEDMDKIEKDILHYISKHILVTADASPLAWKLSEVHPDPEAIWITLEAALPDKSISTLKISNDVLMDVYNDQKNIVNLSCSAKTKSLIFEKGDKEKLVSF